MVRMLYLNQFMAKVSLGKKNKAINLPTFQIPTVHIGAKALCNNSTRQILIKTHNIGIISESLTRRWLIYDVFVFGHTERKGQEKFK